MVEKLPFHCLQYPTYYQWFDSLAISDSVVLSNKNKKYKLKKYILASTLEYFELTALFFM